MRSDTSGKPAPKATLRGREEAARRRAEEARRRYFGRLREAVRERREGLVIDAVLGGHRDVEGVTWRTGLPAAQVRRVMRDLERRHRGETLEGAVRLEVAARRRTSRGFSGAGPHRPR